MNDLDTMSIQYLYYNLGRCLYKIAAPLVHSYCNFVFSSNVSISIFTIAQEPSYPGSGQINDMKQIAMEYTSK